jgi:hypothetical protein
MILTGREYTEFRFQLWSTQSGKCCECGRWTFLTRDLQWDDSFHVAHRGSRGMGSAIRDDVLGPNRGQVQGGLCGQCHRKQHGQ